MLRNSSFHLPPGVVSEALSFAAIVGAFLAFWLVLMPLDAYAASARSDAACVATGAFLVVGWLAASGGGMLGFLIASILTAAANADRAEQSYRRSRVAEEA